MKKIVLILLLLPTYGYAAWMGERNLFHFQEDAVSLAAPAQADTAFLYQPSRVSIEASWQLQVQLDFVPSSSNSFRFYLVSDAYNLEGPLHGYFVQLGGAAKQVALYEQNGKTLHVLTATPKDFLSTEPVQLTIRVERNAQHEWRVSLFSPNQETVELPVVVHAEHVYSLAWGVVCKYTKTRSQAMHFSSWRVDGKGENPPPVVQKGQLYLNEILYDPPYGGVDFVEVYNASSQTLALQTCSLSNGKSTYPLPTYSLSPHAYLALTPSEEKLSEQYETLGEVLECSRFPSLVNDSGWVFLLTSKDTIDALHYSDTLHHPLVSITEGISLERQAVPPAEGAHIWTSASTLVGATPGLPNSLSEIPSTSPPQDEDWFWLSSSWFSPYQTVGGVRICHHVPAGCVATAWVFDFSGIEQRQLYNNTLLPLQGETYWDGTDTEGHICLPGIYAIVVEILLPDDSHKRWIKAVALGN